MRGGERDAQSSRDEQHDRIGAARLRRKIFCVAGERAAGVCDHPFVQRRGNHCVEASSSDASERGIEQLDHIGRIGDIESAGVGRRPQCVVFDRQRKGQTDVCGTRSKQRAITQHHDIAVQLAERGELGAQLGADACGLARGDRNAWPVRF